MKRHAVMGVALAAVCAVTFAACDAGAPSPMAPSAVAGLGGSANADGSTLKVSAPVALFPPDGTTNVTPETSLTARVGAGLYQTVTLAHRFQVSDSNTFGTIIATGTGAVDSQGLVRYVVAPALPTGRRVFWRVRAELEDAFGPWSAVLSYTSTGSTPPPTTTTPPPPSGGNRTPDPPAGQRLPLPDMRGVLAQHTNFSDSCPLGVKYVNNPWQDRVIDAFRQTDTRWGYNGKPNRTAADNGGRPVVAAGDEAAYHFSAGADQGSTDVHLVDMLVSHCGSTPSLSWRVFTGEEPGFWTGAGRF